MNCAGLRLTPVITCLKCTVSVERIAPDYAESWLYVAFGANLILEGILGTIWCVYRNLKAIRGNASATDGGKRHQMGRSLH
jgi:hypothetical protein